MNFFKRLFFIGVCSLLASSRCWTQENSSEPYKRIFSSTVAKINTQLKLRGIADRVVPSARVEITEDLDVLRHAEVVEVNSNPEINVKILPKALHIISIFRDISSTQTKSYDNPPKPTWTKGEAIEQARDWYTHIIGTFPKDVGSPTADWQPGQNPPKYYDGEWTVQWPRIDAEGHLFASDTVSVVLSEEDGVTYISDNFTSQGIEKPKVLVSQSEAIKLGEDPANRMLHGPLAAAWSSGLSLQSGASAQLLIVNPNHILDLNNIGDLGSAGDTKARLAWVIKYRASNANGMGSYIYVWIDAETKAVLGGDFQ